MKPIEIEKIPYEFTQLIGGIKNISFPKQGCTSSVGIVTSEKGKFVLKKSVQELYRKCLFQESKILHILNNTSLPVPKRYKFTEDRNSSWLLMSFIEGETIRSLFQRGISKQHKEEILYNYGQVLRDLHSTTCPKELTAGEQPWLEKKLIEAEYNLKKYEVDGTKELLNNLMKKRPIKVDHTLIHGDFTIDNVLVQGTEIVGIIDWSGGAFGDPRYDLTLATRPKPYIFNNEIDREIFYKGYGIDAVCDEDIKYFNDLYEFF
ncbi:phosphotransferase [Caldalkalibacillus salinus]|uniref:phosphotransferase n=1 Tax=Caldalkalibacillus salinus TaxID=2803787 RepID=UPI0019225B4B|nr:phosphotransferase [Caldalkalibacillus salinus]